MMLNYLVIIKFLFSMYMAQEIHLKNVICREENGCKIVKEGNVILVIFLPLCLNDTSMNIGKKKLFIQSINYVIGQTNKKMPLKNKHLNISFGYVLHDTCGKTHEMVSNIFLSYLIKDDEQRIYKTETQCICRNSTDKQIAIAAFIGEFKPKELEFGINILLPYEYPIITISLYAPEMSRDYKGIYVRMPWIGTSIKAVVDMFVTFKWSYTAIIVSDNEEGNEGKEFLQNELENVGASIAFVKYFDNTDLNLQEVMRNNEYLKVVYVWLDINSYMRFFEYADKYNIHNITWIVNGFVVPIPSSFWKSINPLVIQGTIILQGAHSKTVSDYFTPGIKDYLFNQTNINDTSYIYSPKDVTIVNSFLRTLRTYQYYLHEATERSNFTTFGQFKESLTYSITKRRALTFYLYPFFYFPFGNVLILQVKNTTFKTLPLLTQIKVGMFRALYVNKYDFPIWAGYNMKKPTGKCADRCSPGTSNIFFDGAKCCWSCRTCQLQYFKNITSNSKCTRCPKYTESNTNRTICLYYKNVYITYNSLTSYKIYAIMALGLFLNLIVYIIIVWFKNTPIIRSSNFPMSILQLFLHTLLCVIPLFYIGKQTHLKCLIEPLFFGTFFTAIVGGIFTKTNYLMEIFHSKGRARGRTVKLRKYKQYFFVILFIIIEACLYTGYVMKVPVTIHNNRYPKTLINEQSCGNAQHIIALRIFVGILLLGCAIQAFRARNLPGSFNEAHAIMYSTFIVSLIFLVSPIIQNGVEGINEKAIVGQLLSFSGNMVLLFFTFGGKCYIVLFRPELNTKEILRQSTLTAMKKKVNRRMSSKSKSATSTTTTTTTVT